ncbi:unnamed protein product, partial [Mycena citricolor]
HEGDVVARANACAAQLQVMLSPATTPTENPAASPADVLKRARALTHELSAVIEATDDPARMEELLDANDTLTALITHLPTNAIARPTLTLQGLGLKSTNGEPLPTANGVAPTADEPPSTPRIDKGKARAVPEPEEPEKVLSPTKLLMGQGDEDVDSEGPLHVEESEPGSPTTSRSKSWVEEEGEVFRKGTILLGPEEMDGEYAGEDLKKELLEAMVERPPPRPLTDEYGMEIAAPESPPPPEPVSPVVEKSVPRPYVTRRSSSASLMSLISPTSSSFAPLPGAGQIPEQPGSPVVPGSPRPYLSRRTSSSALDS